MAANPIVKLESITESNAHLYELLALKTLNDSNFTYFQKRHPLEAIRQHCRTIVLLVDGELAGYYHLDAEPSKIWFGIYILEQYRHKGFGKLLLSDALQFAIEKRIDLYLMVYRKNTKAFLMYKKMNFEIISQVDEKIFMCRTWGR